MITNSIYEKKLVYAQERQKILNKYFNMEGKYMLDRRQENFLEVADYCCKAIRYVTEIESTRKADYLWEKLRPEWQKKGGDMSACRFRKLMKNVYVVYEDYNLHNGLRLIILDSVVSKACNSNEYYRLVVALMKAKNEQRLLGILKLMFVYYNDLKTPSYKGGQDV